MTGLAQHRKAPPRGEAIHRLLLVGPPPFKESGGRVIFEGLLEYFNSLPGFVVHQLDLPVHHPLYRDDGTFGPLHHSRTVVSMLRAMVRMARVDTVILSGPPAICFSYGSVLALCAKLFRIPSAALLTGGRGTFSTKRLPAPARTVCFGMFRAIGRFAVETEAARDDLPNWLRSKTQVIGGFRPKPSHPPAIRRSGGGISFAFVGRHGAEQSSASNKPEKGLDVLLDAFDQVCAAPDRAERIDLHVYGSIPIGLAGRVRRTPDVVAHGVLPHGELHAELRRRDVLVFPSRYGFEGIPGAIMEAFMAGLPVIASDLPGPMEIVEHEVNGLVVPVEDSDAFARAMNRLSGDQTLRRQLAAGAWASTSRFDRDKVLPELAAAFGLLPAFGESSTTGA